MIKQRRFVINKGTYKGKCIINRQKLKHEGKYDKQIRGEILEKSIKYIRRKI